MLTPIQINSVGIQQPDLHGEVARVTSRQSGLPLIQSIRLNSSLLPDKNIPKRLWGNPTPDKSGVVWSRAQKAGLSVCSTGTGVIC